MEPSNFYNVMVHLGWTDAVHKEINSLLENQIWELIDNLPIGKRPINAMWISKAKSGPIGLIEKSKARIVAKRNEQTKRIDYLETFASIVRWTTITTIIALTASKGWKLHHLDIITAFLNELLEEEVYMIIPPSFPHVDKPANSLELYTGFAKLHMLGTAKLMLF